MFDDVLVLMPVTPNEHHQFGFGFGVENLDLLQKTLDINELCCERRALQLLLQREGLVFLRVWHFDGKVLRRGQNQGGLVAEYLAELTGNETTSSLE